MHDNREGKKKVDELQGLGHCVWYQDFLGLLNTSMLCLTCSPNSASLTHLFYYQLLSLLGVQDAPPSVFSFFSLRPLLQISLTLPGQECSFYLSELICSSPPTGSWLFSGT